MTEREAQVLIADQLGLSVVSIPNVSVPIGGWNWYEADLIYFRPKSGYLTEVEIKLDYQDFVHDFEKKHYHDDRDVKYFYYAFSHDLWESRKTDILNVLADKNPDAGIMTIPTPAFPNLIIRRARPRKGVDRLTPERQMKYMRIGAYKWWKRHSEEVIRRCIEDEYREDDVNDQLPIPQRRVLVAMHAGTEWEFKAVGVFCQNHWLVDGENRLIPMEEVQYWAPIASTPKR